MWRMVSDLTVIQSAASAFHCSRIGPSLTILSWNGPKAIGATSKLGTLSLSVPLMSSLSLLSTIRNWELDRPQLGEPDLGVKADHRTPRQGGNVEPRAQNPGKAEFSAGLLPNVLANER